MNNRNVSITIGEYAFADNFITSARLSNNIASIGDYAFGNNLISNINFYDGLTTIGARAFIYNPIARVEIPNSVTSIGSEAFRYNQLTDGNVIIDNISPPDGTITLGEYVFENNGEDFDITVIPIYSRD